MLYFEHWQELEKEVCGGEGAGRAPSPAPEDQSAQVRAVSWLVLTVKRQRGCDLRRTPWKGPRVKTDYVEKLVCICVDLSVFGNKDVPKSKFRLWLCVGEPRGKQHCHTGAQRGARRSRRSGVGCGPEDGGRGGRMARRWSGDQTRADGAPEAGGGGGAPEAGGEGCAGGDGERDGGSASPHHAGEASGRRAADPAPSRSSEAGGGRGSGDVGWDDSEGSGLHAPCPRTLAGGEASGPCPRTLAGGEASGPSPFTQAGGEASGPSPCTQAGGEASGPCPCNQAGGEPAAPVPATRLAVKPAAPPVPAPRLAVMPAAPVPNPRLAVKPAGPVPSAPVPAGPVPVAPAGGPLSARRPTPAGPGGLGPVARGRQGSVAHLPGLRRDSVGGLASSPGPWGGE